MQSPHVTPYTAVQTQTAQWKRETNIKHYHRFPSDEIGKFTGKTHPTNNRVIDQAMVNAIVNTLVLVEISFRLIFESLAHLTPGNRSSHLKMSQIKHIYNKYVIWNCESPIVSGFHLHQQNQSSFSGVLAVFCVPLLSTCFQKSIISRIFSAVRGSEAGVERCWEGFVAYCDQWLSEMFIAVLIGSQVSSCSFTWCLLGSLTTLDSL